LKLKLVKIIFNSKRTQTVTEISWVIIFKEVIAAYSKNHTKPTYKNTALETVKIGGTCNYHLALMVNYEGFKIYYKQ
jgi:hypothetical protein